MLRCFLATENLNVKNFSQLSGLDFLKILSRSKMIDSLLVSYAETSSNFTLICWSVSSVSAVFLIASKLCKSDWLTDWLTDWRAIRDLIIPAAAVVNNRWRLYSLFASAYQQIASLYESHQVERWSASSDSGFSPAMWSCKLVGAKVF